MTHADTLAPTTAARTLGIRIAVALAGAIAVAAAAQIALPLPGTPVPLTLQPLAVLLVGGLLGPRLGTLSMVLYLAMGAAGLPVFTPAGAPGLARLFGPTGGYLLAYPLAAALTGVIVRHGRRGAVLLGPLAGMAAIHFGGIAQLMVLTGSAGTAVALGGAPFVLGDLVKIGLAALLLRRFASSTRALL